MKTNIFLLLLTFFIASCNNPDTNKKIPDAEAALKTGCILSQLTYCISPQLSIEKYLPGWKIVWDPEAVGGNYAFIATDGTNYSLAIRGSLLEFSWDAFQNWFHQDLNIAEMKNWDFTNNGSNAEIAQGAYDGWMNINKMKDKSNGKSLQEFLSAETRMNTSILVTGHSLGGNLATVYASYLWHYFNDSIITRKNLNVITFGAPAAGNRLFTEDFNAKFPYAVRVENTNDMIPKFPCRGKMAELGNLFSPSPSASEISVGYKNLTTTLDKVFEMMNAALIIITIKNGGSAYTQTSGNLITIPLSGKNQKNEIDDWLNEAAYQHSMEQYAAGLGVPVIPCGQ